MDIEQTVKDLQAQNAQFQQMFLTLAKGQEYLKTLMIKEKKKKAKKSTSVLNLGRRFKGQANRPWTSQHHRVKGTIKKGKTRK